MTAATARFVEDNMLLSAARRALAIEARAVEALGARLGPEFVRGLPVVSGLQRPGDCHGHRQIRACRRKIAATLASTGTPGFFLQQRKPAMGIWG